MCKKVDILVNPTFSSVHSSLLFHLTWVWQLPREKIALFRRLLSMCNLQTLLCASQTIAHRQWKRMLLWLQNNPLWLSAPEARLLCTKAFKLLKWLLQFPRKGCSGQRSHTWDAKGPHISRRGSFLPSLSCFLCLAFFLITVDKAFLQGWAGHKQLLSHVLF